MIHKNDCKMINENIRIDEGYNQREVVAYRFSKIFDEPFTNEALNEYSKGEWTSSLASGADDMNHTDLIIKNKNGIYRCDCKTRSDGYCPNNKITEPSVLTIGEYAYNSRITDFISFFGLDGNLYMCSLSNIRSMEPYEVKQSKGFNNHMQNLYIFRVFDIMNDSSVIKIEVSEEFKKYYNNGYELYNKYRREIRRMTRLNDYYMIPGIVETFERELREIIHSYNSSLEKDKGSSVVMDDNLNEVCNILSSLV